GSYLYLKGGEIEKHQPAALRQGTKIVVENLFYNTPARLKYVKTIQTELAHIGDIVNRLALAHADIAFHLVHDNNEMLKTAGNGDLKQTIASVYGITAARKMRSIAAERSEERRVGKDANSEMTK